MQKDTITIDLSVYSGGSKKGGARDARPRVQFLSFSCSFREKYGQIMMVLVDGDRHGDSYVTSIVC